MVFFFSSSFISDPPIVEPKPCREFHYRIRVEVDQNPEGAISFPHVPPPVYTKRKAIFIFDVYGKEYPLLKVHISSQSHPFYTGQEKLMDVEGRVDRSKARQEAAAAKKDALKQKAKKAANLAAYEHQLEEMKEQW